MFVGHFAVGFAARRAAPEASLGTLFFAAQFADLLWPTLVLAGVESFAIRPGLTPVSPLEFTGYPWSHSLLMLAVWGLLVGLAVRGRRSNWRVAAVVTGVVVSHWLLDWVSHVPDLPLAPGGGPRLGLGLWRSRPASFAVELALLAVGVTLYARATRPRDRVGRWGLIGLVALLAGIYVASFLGPPPPGEAAVVWSAEAGWLFVAAGWWVDRHRTAPAGAGAAGRERRPAV